MKNIRLCLIFTSMTLLTSVGCNKKDEVQNNTTISIENISGTYALKALIWEAGGQTLNVYNELEACDKDNLIKFNTDKTANFIDAGLVCDPTTNENGIWDIVGDSLYFSETPGRIKSFDGKTLVLVGHPNSEPTVTSTTTLEKQ